MEVQMLENRRRNLEQQELIKREAEKVHIQNVKNAHEEQAQPVREILIARIESSREYQTILKELRNPEIFQALEDVWNSWCETTGLPQGKKIEKAAFKPIIVPPVSPRKSIRYYTESDLKSLAGEDFQSLTEEKIQQCLQRYIQSWLTNKDQSFRSNSESNCPSTIRIDTIGAEHPQFSHLSVLIRIDLADGDLRYTIPVSHKHKSFNNLDELIDFLALHYKDRNMFTFDGPDQDTSYINDVTA